MATPGSEDRIVYWYELSKKEKLDVIGLGLTYGQFLEQYKQPLWCNYPQALSGVMGCWSLCDPDREITKDFCSDCPECNLAT